MNQHLLVFEKFKNKKSQRGKVIRVDQQHNTIYIKFFQTFNTYPLAIKIQYCYNDTCENRMLECLEKFYFSPYAATNYIYDKILGCFNGINPMMKISLPSNYSVPNLPQLNQFQIEAVKQALQKPFCLIQGPPGTGKTITAAYIAFHLTNYLIKQNRQMLVCAPSNVAIDEIAEKISQTKLKVLRVCSKTRQAKESPLDYLSLHYQLKHSEKFQRIKQLYNEFSINMKEYKSQKKKIEQKIIEQANIICTTCINAADKRLKNFNFYNILIDEATQAIEPECLVPLTHLAKQIILIGDHKQLGPVINKLEVSRAGLKKSLFERMIENNEEALRLQIQYRMHPELSKFPNQQFYEGTLLDGISNFDRKILGFEKIILILLLEKFPWANKKKPMFFFHIEGNEEPSSSGTSYFNHLEAGQIQKYIQNFLKFGVKPEDIGIITPYTGQKKYLMDCLEHMSNRNITQKIEVSSVDGFQGREKVENIFQKILLEIYLDFLCKIQ